MNGKPISRQASVWPLDHINARNARRDEFAAALDHYWPEPSRKEMIGLTNEATRVTEAWHRVEPFASALTYRGVNLGEAAERFLVSHVTLGLRAAGNKETRQ
jgi:hypothetical protein